MRFHWQNLNEKKHGRMGWGIFYGRAWLAITERWRLSWTWVLNKLRPEIDLFFESGGIVSGDNHCLIHGSIFGIGAYIGFSAPFLAGLYGRASNRDGWRTGICLRWDRTPQLNIDVASREMSWRSKDPWWCKGVRLDFADILLGRREHSREVLSKHDVVIPMPEGSYAASVELDICRWKRKRWPFALTRYGSQVDIPSGIPFAGKGENSWDCGDDGLYGINPSAETVEEAIAATVESVLKSRRRNGPASFLRDKEPVMASQGA